MNIKKNIALSDSGYLFNPSSGESFIVNPIGIEIIDLVKQGMSFSDISKNMLQKYNTDEATFEKDYFDFTNMLRINQLSNDEEKND